MSPELLLKLKQIRAALDIVAKTPEGAIAVMKPLVDALIEDAETIPADEPVPFYPWPTLAVGESFRVETTPETQRRILTNLSSAGINWSKRNAQERRFSVRRSVDGNFVTVTRLGNVWTDPRAAGEIEGDA